VNRRVPLSSVPVAVVAAFFGAWLVSEVFPIPSFDWRTEATPAPATVRTVSLRVRGLKCRHSSEPMHDLLFGREDGLRIEGYLRAVLYPAPGVGEMQVTFDPARTDVRRIAKAVKLDRDGQETVYRVLLEVKPDRSSPAALLRTLARALEEQHAELFFACHRPEVGRGVDFDRLVTAWNDLFLEDLVLVSGPDASGRVRFAGTSVGAKIRLRDLGSKMDSLVVEKSDEGWLVSDAAWDEFKAGGS
jgi:hypothetical protein